MAQAGLYTAGQLHYRPFHTLFTRISGSDNMIKGMSSFVVEMYEMGIYQRDADHRSLVLGDELCRGTEMSSGTSITLASLEKLLEKRSCFIFATHMHEMTKTKSFLAIRDQLQVRHLDMYYDSASSQLIINRQLQPGSGPSIYGIEVARSLGFKQKFIKRAQAIRREIMGLSKHFLSTNKSRYSSKVYKDCCLVCGAKKNLHIHHLLPQKLADENGFIGSMPKNLAANQDCFCQTCHQKIHKGQIDIQTYQTIEGQIMVVRSKS